MRVASEFAALLVVVERESGTRVSQSAVARRLGRTQSYVSEQWRGRRPLGLDVIEAAANVAKLDPEMLMLALALCIDSDVSGMSDAEVLDSLPRGQVSGRAYELAAKRRAGGENASGIDGDADDGGETPRG